LYDVRGYAAWGRALYQQMPLPADAHVLFESTIDEPTGLLAQTIGDAFGQGVTDRFQSVFGRGNPYLIKALARRYEVAAARIVPTTGVANGVVQVLNALAGPGDHVVVETPGFDVLTHLARLSGADVSEFRRSGPTFDIDPEALRATLRPETRLVILTNIHNPSGHMIGADRLRAIADVAATVGAHVLVDEIYLDFAREADEPIAARIATNMISVNSLTKVFGLFSLRCGWIIAMPAMARRIEQANASREFGVSKLTHAIAAHVLEAPEAFEAHWRSLLAVNRPIVERHVAAMRADGLIEGEVPPYGCIYFPRMVDDRDTWALAEGLWRDHGIVVAPGEFFGSPGHIRLGFGGEPEGLDRGLGALHSVLRRRRA
jgi:aspartate/methionine/tyrosine aminotransferase